MLAQLALTRKALLPFVALASGAAMADWRVAEEQLFVDERRTAVALVEDDSGDSLRVFRDVNGTVWAIFSIRDGFDMLAGESCPTYLVDGRDPVNLPADGSRCILEPKRAHFTLGDVDGEIVRSRSLLQLINGKSIVFRYHLAARGYRETKFTLRHSKQALRAVLGDNVRVSAE